MAARPGKLRQQLGKRVVVVDAGGFRARRHPCVAPVACRSFACSQRQFRRADSHTPFGSVKPSRRSERVKTEPPSGRSSTVMVPSCGGRRRGKRWPAPGRGCPAASGRAARSAGRSSRARPPARRDPRPAPAPTPSAVTSTSIEPPAGVWRMAFSTRLRTARNSASEWPCTQTGVLDAGQRDGLAAVDGQRRHEGRRPRRRPPAGRPGIAAHHEGLELGDVEHLVDRARHVDDVGLAATGAAARPPSNRRAPA